MLSKASELIANAVRAKHETTAARRHEADSEIGQALIEPAEDQATALFFQNYVSNRVLSNTCGNFQYLSHIYSNELVDQVLSDCVIAVGFVSLANLWKSSSVLVKAHVKYCSALRLVNQRLGKIDTAKSHQTLASIILLGLYEITSCLQRHVPVPTIISKWSETVMAYETPVEAASTQMGFLATKLITIRASLKDFHDYDNSINTIGALWSLDMDLRNWVHQLPPDFQLTKIGTTLRLDDVYADYYDDYSSVWVAFIWLNYRSTRLIVNELLVVQTSNLLSSNNQIGVPDTDGHNAVVLRQSDDQESTSYSSILSSAISTIHTLSQEICASVTYCLFTPGPRILAATFLLWPLFLAGQSTVVPDDMRRWTADRLSDIAEKLGVMQATPMARTLRLALNIDEFTGVKAALEFNEAEEARDLMERAIEVPKVDANAFPGPPIHAPFVAQ
ncbi:hypothetical protein H2200_007598 [Cladophialophora chaetospira]|uniref:Uncharacterized protein n=1 Tax=Cladophialophora chaetospira TaxID=386627 RepID=A0AA38X626_9EURO|nr:hypothetical protein H2200_007598 [Cladophialophora chaetospira]